MSARDAESGSSTYRGGSGNAGGLGNGGVGGGMGGGHRGGGAGYNGGIGSRTGITTGKDWYGNSAFGRAGGNVAAYGTRDARSLARAGMGPTVGRFSNFRSPNGAAMFGGSPVQGQSFRGMNMGQALSQANRAQAAWQQAQRPPEGLLSGTPRPAGVTAPAQPVVDPMSIYATLKPLPSYPAYDAEMALPEHKPLPELDIPFPDEVVPAPPVSNSIVTGMLSPDPVLGSYRSDVSTVTRGGWPGQNSHFSKGQGGKLYNDRVPQDPNWRGNSTGKKGYY